MDANRKKIAETKWLFRDELFQASAIRWSSVFEDNP